MDTRKVAVIGSSHINMKTAVTRILEKEREIEIVENSDLITQQEQLRDSHPIHMLPPALPTVNYHNNKRTDENRLKEYGIDSLDKLLEECVLISQKQSKLPRSIRDIIVRTSIQAFKELNMKAEEIKKESLENNTKEDDRQEQ